MFRPRRSGAIFFLLFTPGIPVIPARMKQAEIDTLADAVAERLRTRGLRRTRALDLLIREMAARDKPVTIAELTQARSLREQCDPATVYRLLMKLEEHGMVPGAEVEVAQVLPFNETVSVRVGGHEVVLGLAVAEHLWVSSSAS